jgi:hypothetical protein
LIADGSLVIERATPAQRKELVQLLVDRVDSLVWSGQARPFFAAAVVAPPDGRRGTRGKATDALAWYASA